MRAIQSATPTAIRTIRGAAALLPPPWIEELFGLRSDPSGVSSGDMAITVARGSEAALITARVPGAVELDAGAFERAVIYAYTGIRQQLGGLFPVRFWNHIPAIHGEMDTGRDRYMVFNAARFHAFERWYGSSQAFSRHVATASGVGHGLGDLEIHCLAMSEPGIAVENPRQIASYRYSRRYGPLPPCFARATTIHGGAEGDLLLVGGTASIRGEDSVHLDDPALQLQETFENLASLVKAAALENCEATTEPLSRYRNLRVYYRRPRDAAGIIQATQAAFSALHGVELIEAELCRSELLVEIEGIARL